VLNQGAIVAVVPTYRPPASTHDLVSTLTDQGVRVVVSDDASPCTSDRILCDLGRLRDVVVVRHKRNSGIGRALNEGLQSALDSGATWLLTVDQDSRLPDGYVADALNWMARNLTAADRYGALAAEVIEDASGVMRYPIREVEDHLRTEEVIQTGTFWNVTAFAEIGEFDETLGMDAVDAAACLALRRMGYAIGLIPGLVLEHSIGSSTQITLAGRPVMITGHSPERRASMLRNRLRLFPAEFAESPRHALRTIRRVLVNQGVGLMHEGERWEKAKGTARGIKPTRTR